MNKAVFDTTLDDLNKLISDILGKLSGHVSNNRNHCCTHCDAMVNAMCHDAWYAFCNPNNYLIYTMKVSLMM